MDLYVCGRRVRVWTSGLEKEGLDTGKKRNLGSFFLKLFLLFVIFVHVLGICTHMPGQKVSEVVESQRTVCSSLSHFTTLTPGIPLWDVPFARPVILNCIRKLAEHEPASSQHPLWFLQYSVAGNAVRIR